jgi:hypothetical protein
MSRFARSARRPDHWASTHERARARAAERLSGGLEANEAAWLDEHLADCPVCAAVAATYDADRLALRALRDLPPQPPRDLWARTASAIERESSARRRSETGTGWRRSRLPLGALSGIAVIALVVGVSTLSRLNIAQAPYAEPDPEQRSTTGGDNNSEFAGADPTPFAVGAGAVKYILREANGLLAVNNVPIDEVCPAEGTAGCPALRDAAAQRLDLAASPRSIIGSPKGQDAIVVTNNGGDGEQILVVAMPDASATAAPSVAPQLPPATMHPVEGTRPPDPSNAPSAAVTSESASPDVQSTDGPPSTESAVPSESPQIDVAASAAPSTEPSPTLSPEPTVAASLAIASGIEVIGESAAFSEDGRWFAFSARPADGSSGPDVYVWRVGDPTAQNLTEDGETTFASWDGDQVVASRPEAAAADEATRALATPVSVMIDPASGAETPAGELWLPAVDPTRSRAIGWSGSIERAEDGTTWTPQDGQLELLAWSSRTGGTRPDAQAAEGDPIVADKLGAFDIRWDETGEWVAVWLADANEASMGRLTLYQVDPATGRLRLLEDAPDGVAALPGFSIGEGRLAWASPPGQEGEGSRIQIVAWSGDGVGSVESAPGDDLVIIR